MKFIVKSNNVSFNQNQNGLCIIDAQSEKELIESIQNVYGITNIHTPYELQIWSNPLGYRNRKRLDLIEMTIT